MRKAPAIIAALALLGVAFPVEAGQPPTVVELFTSEGCSSCPPADALLAELASRPEVLALSWHVDYWDRLGWKDPYSSAAATARQRDYARTRGTGEVYTPQIVVDGHWQAVGSDRSAVEEAIGAARHMPAALPVTLTLDPGNRARVTIGVSGGAVTARVVLVAYDRRHVDAVSGGENDGRTLAHVDVVRGVAEIGRFDGSPTTIQAPVAWHADKLAVLVEGEDGHILGGAAADATTR